MSSTWR